MIQLAWLANVQNMGPYVAEDQGYYSEAGVDVELLPGGPSTTVEPLVASGQADIGVANLDSIARAVAEGGDFTVIAGIIQRNPQVLLSLADDPLSDLADIEGREVCVQTAGRSTLEAILEANGIDVTQVEFVTSDIDPAPLVAGECSVFLAYANNQPVTLELSGVSTESLHLADYGYDLMTNALFVRSPDLEDEDRQTVIKAAAEATAQGWTSALDDTDSAAQLIVEGPGADLNLDLEQQELAAESFVELIRTEETAANGLLTLSDETIQRNLEILDMVGIEADADLFDTSLLGTE
ncbi:ABC transporter substrate-binding protein [Nesterenkonia flava]|uniref:ABC transporter substrate-binding protein n=1 Tax=Nesterenkonia flava TaxID=469799 RepID=UPI0031DFE1B9